MKAIATMGVVGRKQEKTARKLCYYIYILERKKTSNGEYGRHKTNKAAG